MRKVLACMKLSEDNFLATVGIVLDEYHRPVMLLSWVNLL